MLRRETAVLAAVLAVATVGCPAAGATTPPRVDADTAPPSGAAGPVQIMAQRSSCTVTGVIAGTDPGVVNPNQVTLDLAEAWRHSRGGGQTVAVIDTGVQPGPRLPNVEAGGDFVASTNGLTDCDGHGTMVAGLIAGQPGADGFSGVAPDAQLLSIRQTSARYSPAGLPNQPGQDPVIVEARNDIATLARAVVRAADMGARIINISSVACVPANTSIDQSALGAALRYAAVDKDAVIIAAAGNTGGGISGGTACAANPLTDPTRPEDPRNWAGVTSVSTPSWWQPYVLSVGALNAAGQPAPFSMSGPWLGLAAPGENITSVSNSPDGGLANGQPTQKGELAPVSGTSYAAAYVSGVAALVRSRFPELSAEQVVRRLTTTARGADRSPSSLVGAGTIDPVAALTWDVSGPGDPAEMTRPVAAPPDPVPKDSAPRTIAYIGTGVLILAAVVTAAIAAHRRKDEAA
ncbi:type VII secretion-associated serine protease mycosin [Mycobacterium sp. Root135]|uniref:type VII secretion-associated serine protease mycosin n=1 Tax=Mycobacterium sp. Root135 TaxID=1736457 RepID=UPI0006FF0429|nr:type VII secretion-associated serine protease mycosin [Mycobacterium sp. Root135]KQY01315.1 type VII secretion-associated serine protease mycosin [Mycobacterium sp. Root135]